MNGVQQHIDEEMGEIVGGLEGARQKEDRGGKNRQEGEREGRKKKNDEEKREKEKTHGFIASESRFQIISAIFSLPV